MSPLPLKKIIPVCILLFCEAFNGNSIFTYVGNMVYDLGVSKDKESVGYYAGLIGSCWYLGQFISSFFWGKMSDIWGRRPIMIMGVVGSLLSTIAFGFSFNLPFAVFARSLNGLLNGNIGVIKTYMAEITDSSNQSRAFGLIGLMWGFGGITGSMIGGITSRPVENLPFIFKNSVLFAKFPYLLPNLFIAAASLTALIGTIIFLKENEIAYSSLDQEIELEVTAKAPTPNDNMDSANDNDNNIEGDNSFNREESKQSLLNKDEHQKLDNVVYENEKFEEVIMINEEKSKMKKNGSFSDLLGKLNLKPKKNRLPKGKGIAVLKDKDVLLTCFVYALVGFYNTIYDEVVPLFAFADISSGGLAFTVRNIGVANAVGGASIIVFQTFFYHRIVNKLKLITTLRVGQVLLIPIMMLIPTVHYLTPYKKAYVWAALLSLYILRQFCTQMVFSPVMTLITNSADFSDMGAVNGLGQSLVALFRSVAPAFGATILAWSFSSGYRFPLNHYAVFITMCLISLIPTVLTYWLSKTLNKPKNEVASGEEQVQVEMM